MVSTHNLPTSSGHPASAPTLPEQGNSTSTNTVCICIFGGGRELELPVKAEKEGLDSAFQDGSHTLHVATNT